MKLTIKILLSILGLVLGLTIIVYSIVVVTHSPNEAEEIVFGFGIAIGCVLTGLGTGGLYHDQNLNDVSLLPINKTKLLEDSLDTVLIKLSSNPSSIYRIEHQNLINLLEERLGYEKTKFK